MHPLTLATIVLALTTAGCVGAAEDAAEPAVDPVEPERAEATTPPPAEAPAPASDEPDAEEPAAARAEVEVPVAHDGKLPVGACAPALPGMCVGSAVGGEWFVIPAVTGEPVAFSVTATWDPETPFADELRLLAIEAESCGNQCWRGPIIASVEGSSPLTLEADEVAIAADKFIVFAMGAASAAPDPLYGWVKAGQPFRLDGTVTALAPPAAPDA